MTKEGKGDIIRLVDYEFRSVPATAAVGDSNRKKPRNGEIVLNAENKNTEEKAITLADLWRVLLTALPLMVIVGVLIVGIGYAYRKVTYRPQYTSDGAFLVMRDHKQTGENLNTGSEAQLAKILLQTCFDLVQRPDVCDRTADKLAEAGETYASGKIGSAVKVKINEDSLIMEAYATAPTPEAAQKILDAFMHAADEYVDEYLEGMMAISSPARIPNAPSTSFGMLRILLIGALGMIVVYGIYLILDMIDDRIRTGEDVADVAGLTLLGVIPDALNSEQKYTYKYGRKYAKHYGRYGVSGTQKKKEG